jgi:hypothetical protein
MPVQPHSGLFVWLVPRARHRVFFPPAVRGGGPRRIPEFHLPSGLRHSCWCELQGGDPAEGKLWCDFFLSSLRATCLGTSSTRALQPPCLNLPFTCGSVLESWGPGHDHVFSSTLQARVLSPQTPELKRGTGWASSYPWRSTH